MDLPGGAGGLVEFKASLLASYGFVTLKLVYLAYDDLPEFPPSIDIEYFEEAANWLSNYPKVMPHGIGVHSLCYFNTRAFPFLDENYAIKIINHI